MKIGSPACQLGMPLDCRRPVMQLTAALKTNYSLATSPEEFIITQCYSSYTVKMLRMNQRQSKTYVPLLI